MKDKFKNWIINIATGRLLGRVIAAFVMAAISGVMMAWGKIVNIAPGIGDIVNPQDLINFVALLVTYLVLLAVSRATGKPVRDLQLQLQERGEYDGAIDGSLGKKTGAALARVANDPDQTLDP
jgi:hypothetical protein